MSVRSEKVATNTLSPSEQMAVAITDAQPEGAALHEGANYPVATPENPLSRTVVVSVRASLNELCLQKNKSTWSPSSEALRNIFQQRKYTGLDGSADHQGDLKAIVLHGMTLSHVKSSFPLSKCYHACIASCLC
mgnify:CR=1 FL=1